MPVEMVNLLIKYEKAIARFYAVCANNYPEEEQFWSELAVEEELHVRILERVSEKVDNNTLFLNEARFKINPLKMSIDYAEEVTVKAERGELTLVSALSIADAIEMTVIESAFYNIFEGDSVRLNKYLEQVQNESVAHRQKVREKLEKVRRESNLS